MSGSCKIIFGPMFSAKSTKLRQEITTLADVGLKTLYINHSIDNRETESKDQNITTHHSGFKGLSDKVNAIKIDKLSKVSVLDYDAIAIDEGQFFEDLEKVVRNWVLDENKIVMIASLDGDFMMKPFGDANKLICISESVEKLSAMCEKCSSGKKQIPAYFTAKFDKSSNKQTDVGGKDKYLPVCMECYQKHMEC
jgi:thymidine kinase